MEKNSLKINSDFDLQHQLRKIATEESIKYIEKNMKNSSVSKTEISRTSDQTKVTVHTAKPGVAIGKKGAGIEKIRKDLSKMISLVLTERPHLQYLSVKEVISLGRYPHTSFWGTLKKEDRELIDDTISILKLDSLKDRFFEELSDGQKQKVLIARAVVQDTPLIFLDEPPELIISTLNFFNIDNKGFRFVLSETEIIALLIFFKFILKLFFQSPI